MFTSGALRRCSLRNTRTVYARYARTCQCALLSARPVVRPVAKSSLRTKLLRANIYRREDNRSPCFGFRQYRPSSFVSDACHIWSDSRTSSSSSIVTICTHEMISMHALTATINSYRLACDFFRRKFDRLKLSQFNSRFRVTVRNRTKRRTITCT